MRVLHGLSIPYISPSYSNKALTTLEEKLFTFKDVEIEQYSNTKYWNLKSKQPSYEITVYFTYEQ